MKRWAWAGACAIVASPQLLLMVVLMLGLWAGIAEVISVANALHYHDQIAALTLACVNMPFAGWMFANYLHLRRDLRELRTPQRQQLLTGALAFFLALMGVAPCALALSWRLTWRDVLLVMLGPLLGITGAALWTLRARRRATEHEGRVDPAVRVPLFSQIPSRSRAIRIALGPPYSPASWRRRLTQCALLIVVLFAPALMVVVFGRSLSSRTFATLMHASEFLSFGAAIALCWLWPLSRAMALFNPQRGASMELALLPGMGEVRQSLRRICRIALGLPAIALALLLLIAMGAAWLERPASSAYVKLAIEFSLIALFTLPVLLGHIARPPAGVSPLFILALSPFYALNALIWNVSWEAFASVHLLLWVGIAIVLMVLISVAGMSLLFVRKLMQRAHPFVDVSS